MVSGGKADCGWISKEKSESGRLWGAAKTVRRKMKEVGGSKLRTDPQSKEQKWEVIGHREEGSK